MAPTRSNAASFISCLLLCKQSLCGIVATTQVYARRVITLWHLDHSPGSLYHAALVYSVILTQLYCRRHVLTCTEKQENKTSVDTVFQPKYKSVRHTR